MESKKTMIELTREMEDKATEERLEWLQKEQQENDMKSSSFLGLGLLAGIVIWAIIMLMCSGCTVIIQPTEYVDRELADMSDGIHADDRIQLEKLINER